jgi:hypothetical protein
VLKSEERDILSGVLRWPECWLRLWTKVVVIVFRERNWRLEVREGKYLSRQKFSTWLLVLVIYKSCWCYNAPWKLWFASCSIFNFRVVSSKSRVRFRMIDQSFSIAFFVFLI